MDVKSYVANELGKGQEKIVAKCFYKVNTFFRIFVEKCGMMVVYIIIGFYRGVFSMIYYFSGTGNSYAVAKKLGDALGEPLGDIAAAMRGGGPLSYALQKGERLGFVFPIYAWAPPRVVLDFVKALHLSYPDEPYIFAVCTCGASAGNGMEVFEIALEESGLNLDSGFSVIMPDNCITLFDAESAESVEKKLHESEGTIRNILRAIRLGKTDFFRIKRGKMADFFTRIVNPIFRAGGMRTKPFYATRNCISCGLCEGICTSGCIKMAGGRPIWTEDRCNMCLACLNRCPAQAIEYGKKTVKRGRYVHPIYQTKKGGDPAQ